jgi:hypothetical protein
MSPIEPTPAVVYAPEPDLARVIAVLQATPGLLELQADGPPENWRAIHLAIDDPNAPRRLLIRTDPAHWTRPAFDAQISGMQQFLSHRGLDPSAGPAIDSLTRLGFAVSVAADAGQREPYLHPDDPAGRIVSALATALDGVVFWVSGLFDANHRLLLGGSTRHPQARPPTWMADPPSPTRVARRFLALVALHLRAQLEYLDDASIDREHERARLTSWIASGGFADEFEAGETSPQLPCGTLDPARATADWWSVEGAALLGWALGLTGFPLDEPSDVIEQLADAVGWPDGVPAGFVASARLRSDSEIRAAQNHLFFWHWRFVDQQANPRRMDFAELGRSAWFGGFDPSEYRLIGSDLAVGDTSISDASPTLVAAHANAALERHRAVNWLRQGRSYAATDVST